MYKIRKSFKANDRGDWMYNIRKSFSKVYQKNGLLIKLTFYEGQTWAMFAMFPT